MAALHLLQSCLVYVNTLMLQRVLAEDRWRERMMLRRARIRPVAAGPKLSDYELSS